MVVDLLVWAAVLAVAIGAVTAAAGGCVIGVRQRRAQQQPEFPPYVPVGRTARWQRSRDDPEATDDLGRPLPSDQDHPRSSIQPRT